MYSDARHELMEGPYHTRRMLMLCIISFLKSSLSISANKAFLLLWYIGTLGEKCHTKSSLCIQYLEIYTCSSCILTGMDIWKHTLSGTVLGDNVMQSFAAPRLTLEQPSSISSGPRRYLTAATIPPPISSLWLSLNPAVGPPVLIRFPLLNFSAARSLSKLFS